MLGGSSGTGQATHDLRRLRTHGLIARVPRSNRYMPTKDRLTVAVALTQTHNRILTPTLAAASDPVAGFPELRTAVSNVVSRR
jgi:hypothetical protein